MNLPSSVGDKMEATVGKKEFILCKVSNIKKSLCVLAKQGFLALNLFED